MENVNPNRNSLYSVEELFKGYDPEDPMSFASTPDFLIYKAFVADRGAASTNRHNVRVRSEHDCSITEQLGSVLSGRKVVAIMGGHGVLRGSDGYKNTARVAAMLTQRGFLVISGGGPGAMEAAHLGAAVGQTGAKLEDYLSEIATGVLDCSGFPVVYTGKEPDKISVSNDKIRDLAAYYKQGWNIRQKIGKGGGIAIPTWMYGWEPTTVFADQVAKYFQNSIREDGLLAAATHGIIYAEGRAGTVQEIFQDAAQNYYRTFPAPSEEAGVGYFSPMVFLGTFWSQKLPIAPILFGLFQLGNISAEELTRVAFTDSIDEAVAVIERFQGMSSPVAFRWAARL